MVPVVCENAFIGDTNAKKRTAEKSACFCTLIKPSREASSVLLGASSVSLTDDAYYHWTQLKTQRTMIDEQKLTSAGSEIEAVYSKVAKRIIPFLILLFVVAWLDRVNVGFAKLQMVADLGFSEAVYGFGAGIFYLTYWFPARRRGQMLGVFMTAVPVAGILGGPISGWIMAMMGGRADLAN